MTNRNRIIKATILSVISLCLTVGSFQIVSAQGPPSGRDLLASLKRALSDAGAPALTDQQQTQLLTAITNYQQSRRSQEPNPTLAAARSAFDEAVLAGDTAAVQAQTTIIVEQISMITQTHLLAVAAFQTQVLGILTDTQVQQLMQRIGTAGLSRILNSLSGRGGFAAAPRPGRGF